MLQKKLNLKKSIEKGEPKNVVKDLFLDYKEAFDRLRNPSAKHYQDYKNLYLTYVNYMDKEIK